jgi:hypothetical protein
MWFRANKMAANISKTKYIIFKPKNKVLHINPGEGLFFNNNDINAPQDPSKIHPVDRIYNDNPNEHDRTYKLLGVLFDENLSFDQHCDYVRSRIAQSNYIINKAKHILPKKSLRTLYFALVHPHLLYCLPLYSCTTRKNVSKLVIMQKKCIRYISNAKYHDHTTPLFIEHNILPLDQLILYTKSLLIHSVMHKYSPVILHNTWITNSDRNRGVELRNADDIYIPLAATDQVKRLPLIDFAIVWNNLPYDKMHSNPTTFKIAIRDHVCE